MTISTTVNKVIGQGNGATTSFSYSFLMPAAANAVVTFTDALGNQTVLNPTQYTLSGIGNPNGGTLTYPLSGSPIATGQSITLQRVLPLQQLTTLVNQSGYYPAVVEAALDNLEMQIQQLNASTGGNASLQFPAVDPSTLNAILPAAAARANRILSFDASGNVTTTLAANLTQYYADIASTIDLTKGAGMVGYNSALAYPANTVGAQLGAFVKTADLQNSSNPALGTNLVTYFSGYTGAIARSLAAKQNEYLSASDFGLATGNTAAQNMTAMAAAIAYANSVGGATIHVPRGTYLLNGTLDVTVNNLRITGDGPDATIFSTSSNSLPVFSTSAATLYQTFDNFSITCSVTRISGAMMDFNFMRRGLIHRVRIQQHWDGINFRGFEQSTCSEVCIVTPSGGGSSIICGALSASNTGANLNILDCFLRGYNDLTQTNVLGAYGLVLNDCQAVFVVNSDIGEYLNSDVLVQPTTSCINCYFVQTFFDGTQNSHCFLVQGAGLKGDFQFTGCWFNGAGGLPGGSTNASGLYLTSSGTYRDWNLTGCRFISCQAPGLVVLTPQADLNVSGCFFYNCAMGTPTAGLKTAVYYGPSSGQSIGSLFTGCKFFAAANANMDLNFDTNSNLNSIVGCMLQKGVTTAASIYFNNCQGNTDPTTNVFATASSMTFPPTKNYFALTGTTTVNGITPTYEGHLIVLVATSAFTVASGSSLHLAGAANFVMAAGSVLTLMCEYGQTGWREISRHA